MKHRGRSFSGKICALHARAVGSIPSASTVVPYSRQHFSSFVKTYDSTGYGRSYAIRIR